MLPIKIAILRCTPSGEIDLCKIRWKGYRKVAHSFSQVQVGKISVTSMNSESVRGEKHHMILSQESQNIRGTLTTCNH